MAGKKWTADEDNVLRKYWKTKRKLTSIVDMLPGRTPQSMCERARRLGLGHRDNVIRGGGSWMLIEQCMKRNKKPMTALEIANKIGMTSGRVLELIRLYRENVYVYDWTEPALGGPTRIFALGRNKIDKPRPAKKSRREINREYMRRMRKDAHETYDKWQKAYRQRVKERRDGPVADVAANWLFNPC